MFGLTLDDAKTIGIIAAVLLAAGAAAAFWVMKTVVQKVVGAVLLAALAFAVWTQRQSLTDCADKVHAAYERSGTDVTVGDTDCSFFGFTVSVSDPRGDTAPK